MIQSYQLLPGGSLTSGPNLERVFIPIVKELSQSDTPVADVFFIILHSIDYEWPIHPTIQRFPRGLLSTRLRRLNGPAGINPGIRTLLEQWTYLEVIGTC